MSGGAPLGQYHENELIHLLLFGNLSPSGESKFGNSISAAIIVKFKVHYCLSHKRGSSPILKQHFNELENHESEMLRLLCAYLLNWFYL